MARCSLGSCACITLLAAGMTAAACHSAAERAAPQPDIVVSGAASLGPALEVIGRQFQADTGVRVALNVGASNVLARQIVEGAPADVFFSADERQMEVVAAAGRIAADTRVDLLSNQLAVVAPAGQAQRLRSARDLLEPAVRRIAIGDPSAVPAGVYTRAYLESIGLWSDVRAKMIPTSNVRAAIGAVEQGNVDAAFVYATDAAGSTRAVTAFLVPRDSGPPIIYPAAVLTGSRNEEAARRYVRYLSSPASTAVFERQGFVTLHRRATESR